MVMHHPQYLLVLLLKNYVAESGDCDDSDATIGSDVNGCDTGEEENEVIDTTIYTSSNINLGDLTITEFIIHLILEVQLKANGLKSKTAVPLFTI